MTGPRLGTAATVLLLAAGVPAAGAQVASNRATSYLSVSDVSDARAVWVNPAGLAVRHEASVHLDLTARDPGARGQLGQVTAGFNARGLSFGYQRDNFSGGSHGHTYRFGLAGGYARVAAGVAIAFYRGGTTGTAWDLGMRYAVAPQISLGAAVRNLGRPVVRGIRQDVAFVPATTLRLLGDLLAVSVQGSFGASTVRGYALAARAELPGRAGLGLLGRVDTDGSLRRRGFAFGLSVGRADRVGLVGSTPGDVARVDAASVYGVSSRVPR